MWGGGGTQQDVHVAVRDTGFVLEQGESIPLKR